MICSLNYLGGVRKEEESLQTYNLKIYTVGILVKGVSPQGRWAQMVSIYNGLNIGDVGCVGVFF